MVFYLLHLRFDRADDRNSFGTDLRSLNDSFCIVDKSYWWKNVPLFAPLLNRIVVEALQIKAVGALVIQVDIVRLALQTGSRASTAIAILKAGYTITLY